MGCLILFTLVFRSTWAPMKNAPGQLVNDVAQYYSYLPAAFIEKDLSFKFPNEYWLIKNQNGIRLPKVTMGMSYMYAPFFFMGHGVAFVTNHKADGYSMPYYEAIATGSMIYVFLGLFLLYHCLKVHFDNLVSIASIIVVYLGTNLFYYTGNFGAMPHGHLFFLFSLILYLSIKFYSNPKPKTLYWLAFFAGLIAIIRPTSVLFLIVPLAYGVYSLKTLKERLSLINDFKISLLKSVFIFIIPIIPQLLYWKIYGGSWLFWSYGEEGFFFNNPHLSEFLFGFRKGWFVYTPIMIFSILGVFFLKKRAKEFMFIVPFLLIITIFLFSSWWCWWFGGGFGARALIQYYVVFIFPIAALLQYAFSKSKVWKMTFLAIYGLGISYNVLLTHKFNINDIHWDAMTKEAFSHAFSKFHLTAEDREFQKTLLKHPDYDKARMGLPED